MKLIGILIELVRVRPRGAAHKSFWSSFLADCVFCCGVLGEISDSFLLGELVCFWAGAWLVWMIGVTVPAVVCCLSGRG